MARQSERFRLPQPIVPNRNTKAPAGDIFQQLLGLLPDAVLIHSDHKVAYVNQACVHLLAANTPEQLIGKDICELIHPDDIPAIEQRIKEHHRTGGTLPPMEHLFKALDGSLVEIEAVAVPCEWNGSPAIEVVLRDIRERKRAQQAAQYWQKRLELAQQSGLKIGLWEWEVSANTVAWSDETCRQFGYRPGTFSGEVDAAVARIHPDDLPKVAAAMEGVLEGGQDYAAQYRVTRPDGTTCWIDARGVAVRNGSTHMIGVGIDITDMKLAELTLRTSEERYLMLLNSTAEGIYGVDVEGICTFCNPAAARMFGYTNPSQLLGRSVHAFHHYTRPDGSQYPEKECSIYRGLEGKGTHIQNELFHRIDGTTFPIDCWSYPLIRDSQVVGAVVTFLDITDRALAEQQLRESEKKARTIIENAPYGIYRAAPDGTILSANPAMVRMLGCANVEEVLSLNLLRDVYCHPEQRAPLLAEALRNGRSINAEVEWKRKDSTTFVVRTNGMPVINDKGNVEGFQVFVEDVTESKQMERKFWQAQKLEAVGLLAGGVAHDFNNVLMIVSSYADLILQRDCVDEKSVGYAKQIHQAALRAANVTQQLLAFSRKQILEPEVLDANGVLKDLGKMLPKLLGEDIKLVIDPEAGIERIRADRGQLEQIIMNLVVNARDAMPKGGCLTIRTRNVDLDAAFASSHAPTAPGRYVLLSVSDTGFGMDAETKARIFEPFFTTKERGKGTGLGLATVYGIVKQSGGFIWVNSEPQQGTTFDIYLPVVRAPLPSPAKPYVPDMQLCGSERILLVEDEEQLLAATREFLEKSGYAVIAATSGAEALRVLDKQSDSIDLLLTDVIMPDLDGVELAAAVRSKYPDLRVLYMSGYSDRTVQGLGSGTVLLRKPFSQQLLASKIREVLTSLVGL